jgi:hypothetical protein
MTMQSNPHQTNPLTIDFSHRLSGSSTLNTAALSDTVDIMTYQASSILNILSDQFSIEEGSNVLKVSDEIIYWTIEAAIKEITDIREIVRAYHYASKETSI